jgi:phosphatidylinositol alpha-1,6-mannosyltransferase
MAISLSETKIWLLTNCPSPYQVELLQELRQIPRIDLHVRFMQAEFRGSKPQEQLAGLQYRILKWFGLPGGRDELRVHPGALWEVMRGNFDVFVLSGLYTSPTFLFCAFILWLRRRPMTLWLERPHPGNLGDLPFWKRFFAVPKRWIRTFVLRLLFAMSWKVICIGSLAAEQYHRIGSAEHKIAIVPYCSNTSRFRNVELQLRANIRTELNIQDECVFLFSGQLIERKGVDLLLHSYEKVSRERSETALLILGDGVLIEELQVIAAKITAGRVIFLGHQPQEKLPAIFAAADVFVFPSRHDGWGVVLNEACAAGLPIIASEETGAAHDLVVDGVNGFRLKASHIEHWTQRMAWLIDNPEKRSEFGAHSQILAQQCSVQTGAEQMARILSDLPLQASKL